MLTRKQIDEWNEQNREVLDGYRLMRSSRKIIIFLTLPFIVILLCFLVLYGLRTYYPEVFRDLVEVSNVCSPFLNNTVIVNPADCSEVNLDVECPECPKCPSINIDNINCDCG